MSCEVPAVDGEAMAERLMAAATDAWQRVFREAAAKEVG
jgi:hypothetical protein